MSGLKGRITQMPAVLEKLLDEERRIECLVESCKKIIRPILGIPEDIVPQIFLTCLDTDDTKALSNNHVIAILLSSAPRWVDIHVSIPFLALHEFSAVRRTLYRLNRLCVECTDDPPASPSPQVEPKFDAFEYAPLLHSFSHKTVFNAIHQIDIPWSQFIDYT
ncbi:hypothetical protein ARMGADRAFT_1031889 [Armillaria gallica]|uniref:F-box domain-containing protein n=1 Tax=Armillaria gallica TaxID=47427 RepID=A0A2H3DK27_ARMGA|nr:hypothetical protein ARMGADRAFT_1031889 [Armillaria gallica]